MFLPDLVVAGNQRGAVQVAVRTGPVVGAVLTYDLTRAASIVTVPAPAGCVAEGQFITCSLGELTTFGPVPPTFFDVSPVFTAKPKDSGTLKVTLSDRSGIVATASATVSIGRVVNIRGQMVPGPPPAVMRDGEITVPLEVKVEQPADGVVLMLAGGPPLATSESFSNCTYSKGMLDFCLFNYRFEPGTVYQNLSTLKVKPVNITEVDIIWLTPAEHRLRVDADARLGFRSEPGTGPPLVLTTASGAKPAEADPDYFTVDLNYGDNHTVQTIARADGGELSVAVPIAVAAVALLVLLLWHWRRRKRSPGN